MTSSTKKFLLILEMNNVLLYMNDPKFKIVDSPINRIPVTYHDTYKNLQVSHRRGKAEFLNDLFINMRTDIDVAVWSNLDSEFTNDLCHRYFTRYYRDLLFVLATNRQLYGDNPLHTPIKIRKDLSNIYNRFQGYN